MAEGDNPFSNTYRAILDPNQNGTIMGAIGGMLGSPTAKQAAGTATGSALSQLATLRAQGMTPQQSLLKFFQTPEGQDFFTNAGPDGLKSLTDGLTATQPPAPTLHNLGPGGKLFSTDATSGKTTMIADNPKTTDVPSDVTSFNYFATLAKLPPATIREFAAGKIDPNKDPSGSEKAIDKLVTDYGLDPRTAEALKAGQVKVLPLKNEFNQDTGSVSVVDLTNPGAPTNIVLNPTNKTPQAGGANPPVSPAPGTTPETGAGTGVLPPSPEPVVKPQSIPEKNPAYFGSKSSMFLGSGAVATTLGAASKLSEQISPNLIIPEGAKAEDRQTLIDTLRSSLSAMGQLGGGIGVNKGVLEGYLKLAPTGGMSESPHSAIQKAIRLQEHIEQEIQAEEAKISNNRLTTDEKKAAVTRAEGWKRVQRDLPTRPEMENMEKAIREGTAGAPTVESAVGSLVGAGKKALTSVKNQASGIQKANPELGLGGEPNIDAINDPHELLKLDTNSLSREGKIKYLRKLDALTKGASGGKR